MRRRALFILLTAFLPFGDAFAGVDVNTATAKQRRACQASDPRRRATSSPTVRQTAPSRLSELDKVPGIGPATLANIGILVEFGEAAAASVSPQTAASTPAAPVAPTPGSSTRININTADAAALDTLPGIGPSKAAAILGDRDANGPFPSCNDLARVTGIGKATVASLADSCSVENP